MNPYDSQEPAPFAAGTLDRDAVQGAFMNRVYQFMALGLATTGLIAMGVANSESALETVFEWRWPLIIGQLGIVLAFSALANRVSSTVAGALFFAYAALTGLTMSFIFILYTHESIASTFFVTGGTFAAMSFYGYTTKRDLTQIGSFLIMGLIGLVIASLVNIFLKSPAITWITTFIGVIVFVGLTAWDTQKIKHMADEATSEDDYRKRAINGALMLYLDFINLFLYLLRLFGKRR